MTDWKPGDMHDGQILGTDGVWRRIEDSGPTEAPGAAPSRTTHSPAATAVLFAGALLGVVLALQSASLLRGTGLNWAGAALAVAAAVGAIIMQRTVPAWVSLVTVLAAFLAGWAAFDTEQQLQDQRDEMNEQMTSEIDIGYGAGVSEEEHERFVERFGE